MRTHHSTKCWILFFGDLPRYSQISLPCSYRENKYDSKTWTWNENEVVCSSYCKSIVTCNRRKYSGDPHESSFIVFGTVSLFRCNLFFLPIFVFFVFFFFLFFFRWCCIKVNRKVMLTCEEDPVKYLFWKRKKSCLLHLKLLKSEIMEKIYSQKYQIPVSFDRQWA